MTEEIKNRIESIRKGEIPKGYRYTKDIGIAPTDWKLGKMSDIIENISRPVPKPDKPYWRLGIKSWAKGTFHAFVDDPETVDMDELYEVKENDLIVNITFAWEHAIAIAKKEDEGLLVSHRFPTYVFKDGQIPEYYQAVISQQYFKDMLDHISPGGAGRNRVLNRKDFLNLPCYIPSLVEQRKIAEVLSTCDSVIELKQELIAEKRKQKKWLMQALFTPDSDMRLLGFEKAQWKQISLGDECVMFSGGTPKAGKDEYYSEGTIPFIRSGEISKTSTELFLTELGYKNCSAKMIEIGDILYALYGANSGDCSISKMKGAINQAILCIRPRTIDRKLLYYLLCSLKEKIVSTYLQGGQGNLSAEIIKKLVVNVPVDEKYQKAIIERLIIADKEISLLEQELETWQQKKKALMQLLLTGIIRIGGH